MWFELEKVKRRDWRYQEEDVRSEVNRRPERRWWLVTWRLCAIKKNKVRILALIFISLLISTLTLEATPSHFLFTKSLQQMQWWQHQNQLRAPVLLVSGHHEQPETYNTTFPEGYPLFWSGEAKTFSDLSCVSSGHKLIFLYSIIRFYRILCLRYVWEKSPEQLQLCLTVPP